MATKYTKWPQNIPNGHKIYQMATKYTKCPNDRPKGHKMHTHVPFQDPPKFTQFRIFGLKICHLATLSHSSKLVGVKSVSITVREFHPKITICISKEEELPFR
jgi:hypothetical protein